MAVTATLRGKLFPINENKSLAKGLFIKDLLETQADSSSQGKRDFARKLKTLT